MARNDKTRWPLSSLPRQANNNPKWGERLGEELEDSRIKVCHDVEL